MVTFHKEMLSTMRKAFWVYQISNLLSFALFTIIVAQFVEPTYVQWLTNPMYLYVLILLIIYFTKPVARRFHPTLDNPLNAIPVCQLFQYIGVGSFVVFVLLKVFADIWVVQYGSLFSFACFFIAIVLSFILKPKGWESKPSELLDDIDFDEHTTKT
jgi:hypothetical protein